jgi:transposase InsO family protein
LGKQVHLPYPSNESVSQYPFDLVYSDVWGPTPFVSKGGHKYYIFIDDFSHHIRIYFMKHRSEALSIYKNFSAIIHTHFDTSIRVFRADSAVEYPSDALRQVLAEKGTLAQFSYFGAHAQNGVAKRKHRHLLETVRALMIASSVPPQFWAKAVSTVTYLINIRPSLALRGGIPFECLCGKTPNYSSLRLFGCVCYVLLAPRERTKLTAQSIVCVFLGYSTEHKGYRCWDLVARRMRTSWDVIFDESGPFYPHSTTDASPASLVDPLSFLLFPDAPSASLPISRLILLSSVSSSESPPVVPDYTMKPPVTQFYSRRGTRLSDASASSDALF